MPPRLPPASAIRKSTAPPQPPMDYRDAKKLEARPSQAFQWAQDHGGPAEEPGYFHLDHANIGERDRDGGPATMSIITPRELLSGLYYGDKADEAIDAMKLTGVRAASMHQPVAHVHRPEGSGGMYWGTRRDQIAPPAVWDGRRTMFTSENDTLLSPQFTLQHEGGHAVNDYRHATGEDNSPFNNSGGGSLASAMNKAGLGSNLVRRMSTNGPYYLRKEELAAQANVAKGLHYGVTGQIPKTQQDFEDMVRGFMGHNYQLNPRPSTLLRAFGDDPIMQHGPRSGEKATGKAFLDALMKSLLNPDDKATSLDVKKAADFFRASDANTNRAAGTV